LKQSTSDGLSTAALVGIVVAAVVCIASLIVVIVCAARKDKSKGVQLFPYVNFNDFFPKLLQAQQKFLHKPCRKHTTVLFDPTILQRSPAHQQTPRRNTYNSIKLHHNHCLNITLLSIS